MGKSKDLATLKSGLSIDGTLTTTSTGTNLTSNSYNVVKIQTDKDDNGSNDDAILQFTTGSSNTVKGELRYDESESKFEIGHGDNQGHIAIDSSGRVTKPNNPSFHAGISAHDTRASGYYNHSTGSSWVTVHNTGNHFSSGTFTAPVAGVYQFNVTLAAAYTNVHIQYWNVAFQKNGAGYIGQNWNGWPSGSSLYKSINNQCAISLQANDYVRVISECNTSLQTFGSSTASNSIFSGFLIG